jgi:hypothetical protein
VVYFSEVGRRASFKMQSISSEFFWISVKCLKDFLLLIL